MSSSIDVPHRMENGLLAMLPPQDRARLAPHLAPVAFEAGAVLYEPGRPLPYLYFPTTVIVAMIYTMKDGTTAEIGLAGNEGVVGIFLFMGGDTMPNRAIVQVAGEALRLQASRLREEFKRGGGLQLALLRYTQAFITQISQTAVCNQLHSVTQRLCRWLLLAHDRLYSNEMQITQEFIAQMLGVRRESITTAAHRLQEAGIIRYVRGRITILDRQRLEATVCECYRVVQEEFRRLLG